MIRRIDISQAVCDQDSVLEETHDLPPFVARLGIELDGLMAVAEQRALRVCMHMDGIDPSRWDKRERSIHLSSGTAKLLPTFSALWLDAFVAGVQCQRRTP